LSAIVTVLSVIFEGPNMLGIITLVLSVTLISIGYNLGNHERGYALFVGWTALALHLLPYRLFGGGLNWVGP
jgi:hypothetical protein